MTSSGSRLSVTAIFCVNRSSEINLRPAKPPHEPARRLVCRDNAVADCEVRYPIGTRHIAVHAVERRRLGGAQIGAAIFELVPIERRDDAVFIYGRGQF